MVSYGRYGEGGPWSATGGMEREELAHPSTGSVHPYTGSTQLPSSIVAAGWKLNAVDDMHPRVLYAHGPLCGGREGRWGGGERGWVGLGRGG